MFVCQPNVFGFDSLKSLFRSLSKPWRTLFAVESFKVYSLFSYQCSCCCCCCCCLVLSDSLFTISHRSSFVNNFFIYFCELFLSLAISLISISHVTYFVNNFFRLFSNLFQRPLKSVLLTYQASGEGGI